MDAGCPAQQFFDPLQGDLTRLEGVEGEAQQGRREDQALHIQDQGDEVTDREPAAFQLSAPQGEQEQQADRRDPLQQREERAPRPSELQRVIPVALVAPLECFALRALLAVDLDGADAREVLLDQIAQFPQGFLLPALLAHHSAAEEADGDQHQGVKANRCEAEQRVDRQHGRQRQGIGQGCVRQAQDGETQQTPDVLHVAGGPADHFTATGALNPPRLLAEHVVKDFLLQLGLDLPADAKDEHP